MATEINILHDGSFDIATGRHRMEKNWKNREMLWTELVQKLSTTHRTAEAYSEYLAAKKSRQDEIKDIGGFVGGYLSGGRRLKGRVMHRQLLTLDIDFAKTDTWEDFTMLYGSAAVVYSTHKHSADTPRLRLIIPLDRPVIADEYMAIARRIAGVMDIDIFDHTTFQPERLMYWPSTSKDGEFLFHYQDGPWLSADEILGSYHNWKDSSEWPVSSREGTILARQMQKQGDPLQKPGVVGAFCLTYTISEAIENFLVDVYDTCDVPDRFTYKEGSTSAGLVVYEDKYAFSHHGTDPVSGKLCNAFDLVRLHKFGLKDEDAREGTPSNKLPSYLAMMEFAAKDQSVKIRIGSETINSARGDFDIPEINEEEETNNDWTGLLDVDKKGRYYSTIDNVVLILKNDPAVKGRFAKNLFEKREVALQNLPWRKVTTETRYITDEDDAGLRHYLEKTYNISGIQKIQDALGITFNSNSFHPVRDYLSSLTWDGEQRIDTVLIEYLGAEDNEYVRAVTRKTLTAAVARVFRPGIKFDYVLTLVGKQGIGKSSLINKLGRSWYSDSFNTIQGKEAFEQIQGVWLVEIGELAGLKKMEMEHVKHFITKQEDRYRVAYGRRIENFPRQCVFFGTTNSRDFLRDPTGNRRFWPVSTMETEPAKDVFRHLSDEEIDQIWAEAVHRFKAGEKLFLSKEIESMAFEKQVEHAEKDDRIGIIQKYLDTKVPANWDEMSLWDRRSFLQGDDGLQADGIKVRDQVCIAEIWCELFGGQLRDITSFNTKDLHTIMQNMPNWSRSKSNRRFKIYGLQRAYLRVRNDGKNVNADEISSVYTDYLL